MAMSIDTVSIDLLVSHFIHYGYWIVFVGILLDNAGLPIPGELLLLMFGAVARTGEFHVWAGVLVAAAGAMGGDSVGYWLGRGSGDGVLRMYCRLTLGSGACVRRAVSYYRHYGRSTMIAGRFVMGVRAFLAPLAGSAGMAFGQFLLVDGVGAVLWSAAFILVGYAFGWQLEGIGAGYRMASAALLAAGGVSVAGYLLIKLYRRWRYRPGGFRGRTLSRVANVLRTPRTPASGFLEVDPARVRWAGGGAVGKKADPSYARATAVGSAIPARSPLANEIGPEPEAEGIGRHTSPLAQPVPDGLEEARR